MRQIKFRAWDDADIPFYDNAENSRMSYFGPEYFINDEGYIRFESPAGKGPAGDHNQERFTLMQFTGLLDKNGVEIYEGDVIKASNLLDDRVVVEWRQKYSGFSLVGNRSTDPLLPHLHPDIEIIGNIYEHPELIGT